MVTFECIADGCSQKNIKIKFFGDIVQAECGGCAVTLQSKDPQPNPVIPQLNLNLETTQE